LPPAQRHSSVDEETVTMTTQGASVTSYSSVGVTSTEPWMMTQPGVVDSDEPEPSINDVENYEIADDDNEDCVCDYDTPTQTRYS